MNAYLRIGLAGLLAAIAMFVWTAIAHMVLPLNSMGISQAPNEASMVAAMQSSIGAKPGLYMFPWVDPKSPDAMKDYEAKAKTTASGMVFYHPPGQAQTMTGMTLLLEFLKQLVCCLIAAFLLAEAANAIVHYAVRVAFVGCIGVVAALTDNLSNLIWYGYPSAYVIAQIVTDWVSYVVAGLVIAAMIKPATEPKAPIT